MQHVLFICSQNRLRSPTAEQVFSYCDEIACLSAGLNNDAENPLTPELVEWADVIFVMEPVHKAKLASRYQAQLRKAKVICLDIPDIYPYMDWQLVQLLKDKVPRHLPNLDLSQLPENFS